TDRAAWGLPAKQATDLKVRTFPRGIFETIWRTLSVKSGMAAASKNTKDRLVSYGEMACKYFS
ncbi:MAG: hypothetical protein OXH63_08850, partial [Gemmatimonadetes bacterium]|nr:hypothetical protein [Gemmatimonadota bacterium]